MISNMLIDQPKDQPFQSLLPRIAVVAAFTHIAFCGLFLWAGIYELAIVNVASTCAHVLSYFLIKRGNISQGFAVLGIEVFVHAVIATFILGWGSGFYYYLILILPVTAFNDHLKIKTKVVLVFMTAAVYVALDVLLRKHSETHNLPPAVLETLYYSNVVTALGILCFIAFGYYFLIVSAEAALIAVANTDPLTQLSNRRSFMRAIDEERARRPGPAKDLTFVLCDIDFFKKVNDTYGHETGDLVLKAVAGLFKSNVRASDKVARWGGEEFIFMFPDTTQKDACAIADEIRQKAQKLSFLEDERQFSVTVTFGITSLRPGETLEEVFARADANLYQGKHAGRNRVIAS